MANVSHADLISKSKRYFGPLVSPEVIRAALASEADPISLGTARQKVGEYRPAADPYEPAAEASGGSGPTTFTATLTDLLIPAGTDTSVMGPGGNGYVLERYFTPEEIPFGSLVAGYISMGVRPVSDDDSVYDIVDAIEASGLPAIEIRQQALEDGLQLGAGDQAFIENPLGSGLTQVRWLRRASGWSDPDQKGFQYAAAGLIPVLARTSHANDFWADYSVSCEFQMWWGTGLDAPPFDITVNAQFKLVVLA